MLGKVLVPTDGSEHSRKAVEYAAKMLAGTSSRITLLTVFENPVYVPLIDEITPPIAPIAYEEINEALMESANKLLENEQKPLVSEGLEVELKLRIGNTTSEIMNEAEEGGFELIIVGSRGHGRLGEAFLGSVSYKLAHHAKCPVLIVR